MSIFTTEYVDENVLADADNWTVVLNGNRKISTNITLDTTTILQSVALPGIVMFAATLAFMILSCVFKFPGIRNIYLLVGSLGVLGLTPFGIYFGASEVLISVSLSLQDSIEVMREIYSDSLAVAYNEACGSEQDTSELNEMQDIVIEFEQMFTEYIKIVGYVVFPSTIVLAGLIFFRNGKQKSCIAVFTTMMMWPAIIICVLLSSVFFGLVAPVKQLCEVGVNPVVLMLTSQEDVPYAYYYAHCTTTDLIHPTPDECTRCVDSGIQDIVCEDLFGAIIWFALMWLIATTIIACNIPNYINEASDLKFKYSLLTK